MSAVLPFSQKRSESTGHKRRKRGEPARRRPVLPRPGSAWTPFIPPFSILSRVPLGTRPLGHLLPGTASRSLLGCDGRGSSEEDAGRPRQVCLSGRLCLQFRSWFSMPGGPGAWRGGRRARVPVPSHHIEGMPRQQAWSLPALASLVRPRSRLSVFSTVKRSPLLPSPNCPFWKEVTTRGPQLRRRQLHASPSRAERLRKMLRIFCTGFSAPHWREFKRTQVEGRLSLPFGHSPAPREGYGRSTPSPGCRE